MEKQAKSLSLAALSAAVTKAVESEQQKSALGTAFTLTHPIIMGRWFDGNISMAEAEGIATRITAQVQRSGAAAHLSATATATKLEPAFIWHGGHIICGFLPPDGLNPLSE